jgi:hypothetical protein
MILLILRRGARRALKLTESDTHSHSAVKILEPSELSVPGWSHNPENPREDRLVVAGEIHPAERLTAVITALDAVEPFDLPHVRAEDRDFVAS